MTNWYQKHAFTTLPLTSKSVLPTLSVISLENTALITATGKDALDYLQGQLTCDLVAMKNTDSTLAAHCDPKGNVMSVLRVFHHQKGLAYTLPKSVAQTQLMKVKKYAVFSDIAFNESEQVLICIAGIKADNAVQSRFISEGNVRPTLTGTAVKVDTHRWLLALDPSEADSIISELGKRAVLSNQSLWDLFELQAGIPLIEESTCKTFIPQALNLQALDAISFKKGCYTGQETVARAKYRGINKRASYLLQGETEVKPIAGQIVDRSVGESWRKGGVVLSSYRYEDGETLSLVVLPNNLESDCQFRLPDTELLWYKTPLPYELEDNH